jgi:hypothetical protein
MGRASEAATTVARDVPAGRAAAYAACGCAFLFAAVSFYWGAGGTFGLDTVGREAVALSRSGNVWVYLALWFAGLVKVAGGLLALALVRPWGSRLFPRWMLLVAGWTGAVLLVLYGGVQLGVQLLVKSGAIQAPADMDRRGFYGHLYLWDPWFLLWGLLLGVAVISYTFRPPGAIWPGRAAEPRGRHPGRRRAHRARR